MTASTFERARSASAKQKREEAILNAAAELALRDSVREVTLTSIATEVGMHKSTMLRYFETREEIFLRLATSSWQEWAESVVEELRPLHAGKERLPAAVASTLASSLAARPLFCELLAHVPLNLERGVSLPAVKNFKLVAIAAAGQVAEAIQRVCPMDHASAADVVATATAMAGALWQMAAPGTAVRELYENDPELAHARVDVEPRLAGILEALISGYVDKQ